MEKTEQDIEFYELRENIAPIETIQFKKRIFGGCNAREVYDHVKFMNDRLFHAEHSFKNQLDEYNTMVTMLTQERDNLNDKLRQTESYQKILEQRLKEREVDVRAISEKNHLLNRKLFELEEMSDSYHKLNELLQEQQQQISDYEANNTMLSESNIQLQMTIEDLSEKLKKAKSGISPDKYKQLTLECERLQDQYQTILAEKEIIITEKNEIAEQSRAAAEHLKKMHEKNKDLWNKNMKQSLEIRRFISAFETKAHEVSHQKMQNLDKIRSNMKEILDILDDEAAYVLRLIQRPYEELIQGGTNEPAQKEILAVQPSCKAAVAVE